MSTLPTVFVFHSPPGHVKPYNRASDTAAPQRPLFRSRIEISFANRRSIPAADSFPHAFRGQSEVDVETGNDAFEWRTNQNHLRAAVERGRCVVCGDMSDKLRVAFAVIRVVFNDTLDISAAIKSLVPVTRMLRHVVAYVRCIYSHLLRLLRSPTIYQWLGESIVAKVGQPFYIPFKSYTAIHRPSASVWFVPRCTM